MSYNYNLSSAHRAIGKGVLKMNGFFASRGARAQFDFCRGLAHLITGIIVICMFIGCTSSENKWRGLSRTKFADTAEHQRTVELLDRLDHHMKQFPGSPNPTALMLLIKGDPQSVSAANKLIEAGKNDGGHGQEKLWLLRSFGDQLTPEAKAHLEESLRGNLKPGSWQWTRSTKFYNINWPITSCVILIVGGETLNDPAAVEQGTKMLQQILDGITSKRLGTVSEFNSPTYCGVDLCALAGLVYFARDESVRLKARILEERLWLDFATRYNGQIGQLAGPFSRVYHDGLVGGSGISRDHIFKVFDDHIIQDFHIPLEYPHYGDLTWTPMIAFIPYNCPDYIRQIALDKVLPYQVTGISAGDDFRGYPSSHTDLHTYITPKWMLASNSRHWLDGAQNAACIAYWGKHLPARGMRDFKVAYARYVINSGGPDAASLEQPEMGRINTLQDQGTVMALYKPKASHARSKEINEGGIRSLRLDLQIPLYDEIEELSVGYRNIDPRFPNVATGWNNRVYLRDGDVYLCVRPLEPTNLGVERPLRIRRFNEFLLVSVYNLDVSDYKQIPDDQIQRVKNGFVLEMGDGSQFRDLDAFRNYCEAGEVMEPQLTADSMRSVTYTNGDRSLYARYNMVTEEFVERQVNGKPVAYPLFECADAVITDQAAGGASLGGASLAASAGTYVWLVSNPQRTTYAAYNFSQNVVPMILKLPAGEVKADGLGFGKIVAREKGVPSLEIWTVKQQGRITFPRALGKVVTLNGKDVTTQLSGALIDGQEMLQLP